MFDFFAIHSNIQGLLLTLSFAVIPDDVEGTICDAGDRTQVGCM